jgi:hypothetical protein
MSFKYRNVLNFLSISRDTSHSQFGPGIPNQIFGILQISGYLYCKFQTLFCEHKVIPII